MSTTIKTLLHLSSWFNMPYCKILLFSLLLVAPTTGENNSAIILLPSPSLKTPSMENSKIANSNVRNNGFSAMKLNNSSVVSTTTSMQGFISRNFTSFRSLSLMIASSHKQNSLLHITNPSFSNTQTFTRSCEFSKTSRVLYNYSTVTQDDRIKNNSTNISFKDHLIKNKTSMSSGSPNRTETHRANCANGRNKCNGYVTRWFDFYLNVSLMRCIYFFISFCVIN